MHEEIERPSPQNGWSDPDPLTIALTLVGAAATVGALGVQIGSYVDDRRRRRRGDEDRVRRALFDADRALNQAKHALSDLTSLLDEYGHLRAHFGLGQAPLNGDGGRTREIKQLYQASYSAGARLNDAFITLSSELDPDDFGIYWEYAARLDEILRSSLNAETYGVYIKRTSQLFSTIENLIRDLGERYGYMRPTTFLNE
jgi:hypothetical protein